MSTQENKADSNRVAQAISKGYLDALDELMAPDLAEEFKRDIAEIRQAFPEYSGTNVNQIAEGENVANRSCSWAHICVNSRAWLRPPGALSS